MPDIHEELAADYRSLNNVVGEYLDFQYGSQKHAQTNAKLQTIITTRLSKDLNRLSDTLASNSKSQEKYLFWQTIMSGALVLATVGLIIATLLLYFK